MEIKDLRTKSEKELLQIVSELKGKLLALRFENAVGQLQETHLIKQTKRDIARVFTVLKQMQADNAPVAKEEAKPAAKPAAKKETAKKAESKPAEKKAATKPAAKKATTTAAKKPAAKKTTSKVEDVIDMTVPELKKVAEKHDVEVKAGMKKAEIVDVVLHDLTLAELKELAKKHDLHGYSTMKKEELIKALEEAK